MGRVAWRWYIKEENEDQRGQGVVSSEEQEGRTLWAGKSLLDY